MEINVQLVSTSKSKSPRAKARSAMLKLIMPRLSQDRGERLAQAVKEKDGDTFQKIFAEIGKEIGEFLNEK